MTTHRPDPVPQTDSPAWRQRVAGIACVLTAAGLAWLGLAMPEPVRISAAAPVPDKSVAPAPTAPKPSAPSAPDPAKPADPASPAPTAPGNDGRTGPDGGPAKVFPPDSGAPDDEPPPPAEPRPGEPRRAEPALKTPDVPAPKTGESKDPKSAKTATKPAPKPDPFLPPAKGHSAGLPFGSGTLPEGAGPVVCEVLEGLVDNRSWDVSKAEVRARWRTTALALTEVPTLFSDRAVVLDRAGAFLVTARLPATLPAGKWQVLLRARSAAKLTCDGKPVSEHKFPKIAQNGHEPVPPVPARVRADLRPFQPGQRDVVVEWTSDGKPHEWRLELYVGGRKLRPELGEPAVAVARPGEQFRLLTPTPADADARPLDCEGWETFAAGSRAAMERLDAEVRKIVGAAEEAYWSQRHAVARRFVDGLPRLIVPDTTPGLPANNEVDRFLAVGLTAAKVAPTALLDDHAFLRRVHLDVTGVPPTPAEIAAFLADPAETRRARAIDRLLADDLGWADHWTSYWQDVLAENPGILKPTLNNTGPFRFWIHRALRQNTPMDRFVTELVRMEGSTWYGGAAGFAVATENDAPMAAKAHTLARAFLAIDMTCARCHDAPYQPWKQKQLFGMAAMLGRSTIKLPAGSFVKVAPGGRQPLVKSSIKPGEPIAPEWLLEQIAAGKLPEGVTADPVPGTASTVPAGKADTREQVAAILTSPADTRFAEVLANRLWKRLMGAGIVEPVDDWHGARPSHPALLAWLGRELAGNGYDLKHLARIILNSHAYQRAADPAMAADADVARRHFAGPARRRMSAEQLVDSLFAVAGKRMGCEEITFDPEGRQPVTQCINLGSPRRAWQLNGLAGERDRPALALPIAQSMVDLMSAYGWRETRPESRTVREETLNPLQPMTLANGVVGNRICRASDDGAFTALALTDVTLDKLIDGVVLRVLNRPATTDERAAFAALLSEGFDSRRTGKPAAAPVVDEAYVSWANHLSPEATELKLKQEARARAGDPPTPRLTESWRLRYEDMIWALVNSPEFVFLP